MFVLIGMAFWVPFDYNEWLRFRIDIMLSPISFFLNLVTFANRLCTYVLIFKTEWKLDIQISSNALALLPERWHSITADVNIGTVCAGNLEILSATRISICAAFK